MVGPTSGAGDSGDEDLHRPGRSMGSGHERWDLHWLTDLLTTPVLLDLTTIRRMRRAAAMSAGAPGFPKSLRGADAAMFFQDEGPQLQLDHELILRVPGKTFNLGPASNTNYLPAAMAHASRGRVVHAGSDACLSCQNGAGPWSECVTLTVGDHEFLRGSCTNCGYSNQFARCTHSGMSSQDQVLSDRRLI